MLNCASVKLFTKQPGIRRDYCRGIDSRKEKKLPINLYLLKWICGHKN